MIVGITIFVSLFVFIMVQNTPLQPQSCTESESGDCIFSFSMNIDGKNRDYDGFPTVDKVNKPIEFNGVRFVYTGSSTPEIDGINCDNAFPRAINSTLGHHAPIIVNYDGYFQVNETRHFTATLTNGQTKSLVLCWNGNAKPKVIQMFDSGSLTGPMFCPSKTNWFDENKTTGIIQYEYCSPNSPYYDRYIAEAR